VQQDKVGAIPSVFPAGPQCEVLFELFTGNLGAVQLGRFLKGRDAGRLVALRRLAQPPSPDLASATDLARSIAHPSLAKLLGQIRCGNVWYLASEQISGVTLFELGRAVTERRSPLDVSVATRIVLEALKAADVAQRLLVETANVSGVRCIYPESIWIAEFGEVFLSELLVAPMLAEAAAEASPPSVPPPPLNAVSADARTATLELLRLVCEEVTTNDPGLANGSDLPRQLRWILFDDEAPSRLRSYDTLADFIDALSALPKELLATDQQVSAELRLVMGQVLERRKQKLEMLERFSLQPKEDDATRVFRVAMKTGDEVDTSPPPNNDPERTMTAPALLASIAAERRLSEPSSERTKIFGSIAPRAATLNAQTLEMTGAETAESIENPVSAVWRQAQALLDSSARRPARRGLGAPLDPADPATRADRTSARLTDRAPAVTSVEKPLTVRAVAIWVVLIVLAATATVIALAVSARASRATPPKAERSAPALGDHQKN